MVLYIHCLPKSEPRSTLTTLNLCLASCLLGHAGCRAAEAELSEYQAQLRAGEAASSSDGRFIS